MNKALITAVILFFVVTIQAVNAHADLDTFLSGINIQAKADPHNFSVKLSAQFGVPLPQVKAIIDTVDNYADAFMCFQIGRMTAKEPAIVVQTYKNNKGHGWGVIAKELGIKPGSPEFHALKKGDFDFPGEPERGSKDKDKAKGKEKKKRNIH